ncbi:His-Xaa-Ser system radical SAM maturase HxsB [Marinobacter halodurans]|uniref:His-Xaa-Ser system radical SAM maturase HxsB n=1 Tax=Marinobacter halodurans TaxID=2528979 RepID=A0ABY1ZH79_9GAMM|nr:His-Xaa-Ser system radical SAM maturase HxsB [Marinobacter halodurans]TBW49535.1 His-Xaa-Ser system radical SAM maturase HxsB [Marinobacter halodurans]
MMLPFNLEPLSDSRYFISNLAGFHRVVARETLELLAEQGDGVLDAGIKQDLARGLFLADSSAGEEAGVAALASGYARRLTRDLAFRPTFMIVPTLRCDHTCRYCQVSRAALGAAHSDYDLDARRIPQVIDLIARLGTAPYKLEIQGGEPLVRFDLVQAIYDEAEARLGATDFEVVITTSLSLLDDTILDWARGRRVVFSTSVDGTEVVHNRNRILPGDNAYQRVKRGIRAIQRQLGPDRVAAVTTVTKDLLAHPEALIEASQELGLTELFVRPVSPYGFAQKSGTGTYSFDDYMAFYDRLLSLIIAHEAAGGQLLSEYSGKIHLQRVFQPDFNGYADLKSPSGFLLDCVLINYDGKVFGSDEARMLQRVNPELDLSCGTVDHFDPAANPVYHKILKESLNAVHPGCEQCAYQPFCGTDPCQGISEQGEPVGDKSRSAFCQYHKRMFSYLIDRYYRDPEARSVMESWCHA